MMVVYVITEPQYDSVICTNYIAAVYLIHQRRMCGLALSFFGCV